MRQVSSQGNLWELFVKLETNEFERPREGWKVMERTPQGLEVIKTQRGRAVKYKYIKDMIAWIRENRAGYVVNVDCGDYGGRLTLRN